MYIRCSKSMMKELNKHGSVSFETKEVSGDEDSFYTWSANLTNLYGKDLIVFENEGVRNLVVLYNPKPEDFANLETLFLKGLRVSLEEEGVLPEVIDTYVKNAGDIHFTSIPDRSATAKLTWAGRDAKREPEFYREDSVIQRGGSLFFNDRYVYYGEDAYRHVRDVLMEKLCEMMGRDPKDSSQVRKIRTYLLKIRMSLKDHEVERIISIPASATFEQLHRAVMITFGWKDYHFHEFMIFDETKPYFPFEPFYMWPVKEYIITGPAPDALDYYDTERYEIRYEGYTRLYEVFEHTEGLVYTYDLADIWEHVITLEEVLEDGEEYPVLLNRTGTRPPEDVGGEDGFEEYLRVINNPTSPDYERTVAWAENQTEQNKTMEEINRKLCTFTR